MPELWIYHGEVVRVRGCDWARYVEIEYLHGRLKERIPMEQLHDHGEYLMGGSYALRVG